MSKNVTKNQHYVPQVYLRGFSKDYEPGMKVPEKGRVYGYDLINRFQSLDVAVDCCKEEFGGVLNDERIRDIAINYCLPFFSEIDLDKPESMLMKMMLGRLKDMYFSVGVDKSGRLITSDKAVYIYGQPEPNTEFEKVIFPITSKLCLVLSGGDEKKHYTRKNFLFPMDDRLRRIVFDSISLNASRWIFANHKMGAEELSWIDMIIEQRKDQQIVK